jgi:cytosine/adenosine deaminase-related metal-dependent hydrolase
VLVHGLALSEEDLDLIAKRQASLVWCPVSNEYLYSRTLPIAAALERGINVCLGADAAMFGSPNLLADLSRAAAILGADHRPETLLAMATTNAARALRLKTGALKPGLPADFFVLQGKHPQDPYRSLCAASLKEIYLVVRDGKPLYGAESTEQIFTEMGLLFDRISVDGTKKIVVTGIKKLLENIQATVGRSEDFYFLPRTGP